MRDRWPPQIFLSLALAVAVAWAASRSAFVQASTADFAAAGAIGQTEPPTGGQPANPDSSTSEDLFPTAEDEAQGAKAAAQRDSMSAVPPDSVSAAPPDSVSAVPPDSAAAVPDSLGSTTKPSQTALPDTLQFLPPPGTATGAAKPGTTEKQAAPKERVGFLGIHPIAILVGIAVLNYFLIKAVTD